MAPGPQEELKKLQLYVKEGAAMQAINPELVASRAFFEMWEELHHPLAFAPTGNQIRLGGRSITLEEPATSAWVEWDQDQTCAVLAIEGANDTKRFGLKFRDGKLQIDRPRRKQNADGAASFGDMLDLMYELIRHRRETHPTHNAGDMTLREFRAALDKLPAAATQAKAYRALRKLGTAPFRKLLAKAIEDMAVDELSNQLTLALDGSYAQAATDQEQPEDQDEPDNIPSVMPPERTPWTIRRDLIFIRIATERVAQAEQSVTLSLEQADVLNGDTGDGLTLRVPVPGGNRLTEGSRLNLSSVRSPELLGWLTANICEDDHIVGRLVWAKPEMATDDLAGIRAQAPRSPGFFSAEGLGRLSEDIESGLVTGENALGIMLGVGKSMPWDASTAEADAPPSNRHISQRVAWREATDRRRPVVLVQGPPGTGKTTVLEDTIRTLVARGEKVLLAAPSNTAVDNAARRLSELPLLRVGRNIHSIAADQASRWSGDPKVLQAFLEQAPNGCVLAGTHMGLLRDNTVNAMLLDEHFDTIVFDEAGMAPLGDILLCSRMARRAVLFGDHQQLPPFPIPPAVVQQLKRAQGTITRGMWASIERSALEWLNVTRGFPVHLLEQSFRCQNPRVMRFASTLFYNARVRASRNADYFSLPYAARQQKYPPSTLSLYRTDSLPADVRAETLVVTGHRPGIENPTEATIVAQLFYGWLRTCPLEEITVITPYRRQARRIRRKLNRRAAEAASGKSISEERWDNCLRRRIATVDSFQGGESDVVLISYVRSNPEGRVGFSDDPNRINVAHTRSRRAMAIVADMGCLHRGARTDIFERMERAFERDGEVVDVTRGLLNAWTHEQAQMAEQPEQPRLL